MNNSNMRPIRNLDPKDMRKNTHKAIYEKDQSKPKQYLQKVLLDKVIVEQGFNKQNH